jgi:hypothetical protein
VSLVWLWAACSPSDGVRRDDHVVVRIPVADPAQVAWLQAQPGFDLWSEHVVDHVDVMLPADRARTLPYAAEVLIGDVQALIDATAPQVPPPPGVFDDWQPLDAIDAHLQALADGASHAVHVEIGTSVEGRPISALELSAAPGTDRLGILVVGAQHAREWVAASSALWIAEHLAEGYGVDPAATELLDRYDVVVVPVANPDGYRHTWTTDRLWRKNRRDNGDGAFGVDLNRNWDAAWGAAGAADLPVSDNWPGTAPFSEPETAALSAYLRSRPRIGLHVDLHCTGQVALHPWGFTPVAAPDSAALDAATADAAAAMEAAHGSPFRSGAFNTALYPAYGVAIDWSYGAWGVTSALFELRDRGQYGFLLPADQIVPAAEEAWAGLLALAARPERPHLSLVVLDPLVPGQAARISVRRLVAGAAVELYRSTSGLGATELPDGVSLALDEAEPLGVGAAGPAGGVVFGFRVPAGQVAGAPVWFQARSGAVVSILAEAAVQ